MFRSHRIAFATIGLAFALAIGIATWLFSDAARLQSTYELQATQKAQEYRQARGENILSRCSRVPRERAADCAAEQYEAGREGERKEYDLQAQLVTSAWTRAMGVAAIVGMAFGILGVGLVYKTFEETRRGVEAARESLNAFKDVERPRLIPNPSSTIETLDDDGVAKFDLQLGMINVGRTTAHVVGVAIKHLNSCEYGGNWEVSPIVRAIREGDPAILWVSPFKFNADTSHYGGFVVYRSSFGEHRSYFCYQWEPDVDVPTLQPVSAKGDDWPEDT